MKRFFLVFIYINLLITVIKSQTKIPADLILVEGKIYTADSVFSVKSALAVRDGKFIAVGTTEEILHQYESGTIVRAGGLPVFPGFIDAHSHFYGYARSLHFVDLRGATSWAQVLSLLREKQHEFPSGWLTGRGWDQNLWETKQFPDRASLDSLFPDRPVVLIRVDGHALMANGAALKSAGITGPEGFQPGEIEVKSGRMTGILSETAADRMKDSIPLESVGVQAALLRKAEEHCFEAGLTGVCDAGQDLRVIRLYDSLQREGTLRIRINAMLSPTDENINYFVKKGIYRTPLLNVRSLKIYADGSLGSRTALLKQPYSDAPDKTGIMVTSQEKIRDICSLAFRYGYQVNTHAIGDEAVRLVLERYAEFLKGKNDLRWRIEHAQVVDPADLPLFGRYAVIPSVQATHATSDMYWAADRLGPVRIRWAYAYRSLLEQNGWLANGTDFPVEDISPVLTFYAAVARKDLKGYPPGGFQPENALTREQALKSVTIWAAKSSFEEKECGSIEPGKSADFVILDGDLMTLPESSLPLVKVTRTYLNGRLVYEK
ncbi:MAG TPA: amidohydrolase [Bacteroidales bacterium]|nr:amidohydrolase [Bacteroidales bacterium]